MLHSVRNSEARERLSPSPYIQRLILMEGARFPADRDSRVDGGDAYSGTFTLKFLFRFERKVEGTVHNNEQDIDGTWERQGSSLTFDDDGDNQPEASASVSGNRLTLTGNDDGISQVWEK